MIEMLSAITRYRPRLSIKYFEMLANHKVLFGHLSEMKSGICNQRQLRPVVAKMSTVNNVVDRET